MTIQQSMTVAAKQAAMLAITTGTLKLALYTSAASLSPTTAVYTTVGEVTGTGYTAGGVTLTNVVVSTSAEGIVYLSCDNASWPGSSFTALGGLLYNATQSNKALAVLNFGSNKTCNNENFVVEMSTNPASSALVSFS